MLGLVGEPKPWIESFLIHCFQSLFYAMPHEIRIRCALSWNSLKMAQDAMLFIRFAHLVCLACGGVFSCQILALNFKFGNFKFGVRQNMENAVFSHSWGVFKAGVCKLGYIG